MNYYNYYDYFTRNNDENNIIKDYGDNPFVININDITKLNRNYRSTLWTGNNTQITLMNIPVGTDVGLEIHPKVDQILVIVQGVGLVNMGQEKENVTFSKQVYDGSIIVVPQNTWHNIINIGTMPLKLYSIYSPPSHKKGTVHKTKADALKEEY